MRRLAVAIVVMSSWPLSLRAQESSLDKIRISLQQPAPVSGTTPLPTHPGPLPRKLGPLTLVRPETRGEFIRVSIPVGELISRAVEHMRAAATRRQEAAAHR